MANRKNAISGTVERKLYYYDLNLYRHCEKNKDNVIIKNQSETIREIFIEIEKIQNRALKEKDDKLKKLIQEKLLEG